MDDVEKQMKEIKSKKDPTQADVQKYVRYLVNVKKSLNEKILEMTSGWDITKVEKALKEVERENSKPRPKRYYVSLKEPLEEEF